MIFSKDKFLLDIEWQKKLRNSKLGLKINESEMLSEELIEEYKRAEKRFEIENHYEE